MASGAGKPPPAPDPATILALQNQYNRTNTVNPFGSSTWSTGANGHETNTVTAGPQAQGAIDRAYAAAETPYTKQYVPQGMDQLASAIMGKVGKNYGLGAGAGANGAAGGAMNTNLKQGASQAPPQGQMPQMPPMGGMGGQPPLQASGTPNMSGPQQFQPRPPMQPPSMMQPMPTQTFGG